MVKNMKKGSPKSTNMVVRVSAKDRAKIHKLAKSAKMTVSQFVRYVTTLDRDLNEKLIAELNMELQEKNETVKKQDAEFKKLFKVTRKAVYLVQEMTELTNREIIASVGAYKHNEMKEEMKLIKEEKEQIVL